MGLLSWHLYGEALFENERVTYLYFIYELDEDLYSRSSYILSSDNKIFNDFEVDNNNAYSYLNKYTSETIKNYIYSNGKFRTFNIATLTFYNLPYDFKF